MLFLKEYLQRICSNGLSLNNCLEERPPNQLAELDSLVPALESQLHFEFHQFIAKHASLLELRFLDVFADDMDQSHQVHWVLYNKVERGSVITHQRDALPRVKQGGLIVALCLHEFGIFVAINQFLEFDIFCRFKWLCL